MTKPSRREAEPAIEQQQTPFLRSVFELATVAALGLWLVTLVVSLGVGMNTAYKLRPPAMLATGSNAPAFTLAALDNPDVHRSLADYRGKPVLVMFWSSQWSPSTTSLHHFEDLQKQFAGRSLRVVAIALEAPQDVTAVRGFASRVAPSIEHLLDSTGASADAYRVAFLPTWFLIDGQGNITRRGTVPIITPKVIEAELRNS